MFSTVPTFPPLTFCTFTATLHLLFSLLACHLFPPSEHEYWRWPHALNLPQIQLSLTSHLLWPSIVTDLFLSASAPRFLSSPSSRMLSPQRRDYTSMQSFRRDLTHNKHWRVICMTGAGAFHRGWDGWTERVCETELEKVLVWIIHSSFVGWINQEIGKQKNTSVLCYISRVYSLKFTFKGQIALVFLNRAYLDALPHHPDTKVFLHHCPSLYGYKLWCPWICTSDDVSSLTH